MENGLYTAHEVAVILADAFGDDCACNFNGNDEWLPYLCELQDACPHPFGVACWEQYLKYKDRKEETLEKYGFTLEVKYKGGITMDVREKLLGMIANAKHICANDYSDHTEDEYIADTLLDNGVTVQEWVSVDDELPEVGGYVVCIAKRNPFSRFMPMVARIEKNGWVNPITEQYISEVTHWMPIPQLPKGE